MAVNNIPIIEAYISWLKKFIAGIVPFNRLIIWVAPNKKFEINNEKKKPHLVEPNLLLIKLKIIPRNNISSKKPVDKNAKV